MNRNSLTERRRKWFLRMCRRVEIDQTVYHGSPLDGMRMIHDYGALVPQGHGELPGDFLCVSVNSNVLRYFSDGDDLTGFVSEPGTLHCLQLDQMHHALLTYEACDHVTQWKADHPEQVAIAARLGYLERGRWGEAYMTQQELEDLLPEWVEGLLFPWAYIDPVCGYCNFSYNDEAEIALTERGCARVWNGIQSLYVNGKELEPKDGWRRLVRLTNRKSILTLIIQPHQHHEPTHRNAGPVPTPSRIEGSREGQGRIRPSPLCHPHRFDGGRIE